MIVFGGWRWKTGGFIEKRVLVDGGETEVGGILGEVGFIEEEVTVLVGESMS